MLTVYLGQKEICEGWLYYLEQQTKSLDNYMGLIRQIPIYISCTAVLCM